MEPIFLKIDSKIFSMPEIKIISNKIYRDPSGLIYVIGEVVNNTQENLNIEIVSYLYKENSVKGFGWSSTLIPILMPYQKSPFRIIFKPITEDIECYSLKIKFGTTKQKPYRNFKILEHKSYLDENGYFNVYGKLKNIGLVEADYIRVIGTFYQKDNSIVAFDSKILEPKKLKANEEGRFKLIVPSKLLSNLINSYNLDFWTPTGLYLVSLKW